MWVLITTSTAAGSTPVRCNDFRKSVLRWSSGGVAGRSRSLPAPVSTSTVRPSTSITHVCIAIRQPSADQKAGVYLSASSCHASAGVCGNNS
jgi:hypothetical protein